MKKRTSTMKRAACALLAFTLLTALLAVPMASWQAPGIGVVQVPYVYSGGITIDGVMQNGEWSQENRILLSEDNLQPFSGSALPDPFEFYYSWGDDGLYMAAIVYDSTLTKSAKGTRLDQFQIAFNPAGIIYKDYSGLFFSFMPSDESDDVYATKHNWQRGDVDGQTNIDDEGYKGKYTETDTGWVMEVLLPWSLISSKDRTAKLDATESITLDNFDPNDAARSRAFCNAIICYIDYSGSQFVAAGRTCNQTVDLGTQKGWTVDTYDITLKFLKDGETPSTETETFASSGTVVEPTVVDTPYYIIPTSCYSDAHNLTYTVNADGSADIVFTGEDPYLFINFPNDIQVDSEKYPYIALYMKTNDSSGGGQLFYATSDYNNINEGCSVHYDYEYEDEHNQITVIDCNDGSLLGGYYSQLRMDLFEAQPEEGTTFTLYAIGLFQDYKEACEFKNSEIEISDIVTTVETTAAPKEDTNVPSATEPDTTFKTETDKPSVTTGTTGGKKGLSTAGVVAIIVGSVFVLAAIIVVVVLSVKKKKN